MITNLTEFFLRGALSVCPDKIALIDKEEQYSFADWDRLGRVLASAILKRGIPPNQPIVVFLPKCAKELISDLGILYSGNYFSNIDCAQPKPRLQNLLSNLCPPLVLTGRAQLHIVKNLGVTDNMIVVVEDAFCSVAPTVPSLLEARRKNLIDTDLACIINTSGSTGTPKSVALSHRGLIDFVLWFDETFRLGRDEVVGSLSPFHFDGYIPGLFMALFRGATLDVIPSELAMFPVRLAEYLSTHHISFIFWVPTIMTNMASLDALREVALPDLRTVCFAGEVLPTRHYNYWHRHLPQARMINLYGPIEISVICTYFEVDREFLDEEPLPIGITCRNTNILVLNDNDKLCGNHEVGELCVRGSSLALGYWNDPENTANAFVQNPLNIHYPELIYRTGDLVSINERGEFQFLGRRDYQVKHQGYRIDLGEIEHFAIQVAGIRNACVLYHRERKEITLIYEADVVIPPAAIRAELGRNLSKYMLPTVSHRIDEMPRTANGKIDRQRLAKEFMV
jgi:amino acid adenylation domain-containing protein